MYNYGYHTWILVISVVACSCGVQMSSIVVQNVEIIVIIITIAIVVAVVVYKMSYCKRSKAY